MRGVFDDKEMEQSATRPDTELTLTSTTLLLFFFGLVLLCGLCFGLGYSMGHHASQDPSAGLTTTGELQSPAAADPGHAKPSADAQAGARPSTAVEPREAPVVRASTISAGDGPKKAEAESGSPKAVAASSRVVQSEQSVQPVEAAIVKPAFASSVNPIEGTEPAASTVSPALASLMVQIAAVAQAEDADVLTGALHKRGYAVVAKREPLDGLIHVRIGPFKTRPEADAWRQKLLNEGYNAIVQP